MDAPPPDHFSATASGFTQLPSPSPLDLSGDAKFINSITASYRMNIYLFSLLDQPYISGQNLFLLPICTLLSTNNAVLTAVIFSHILKLESYKCKQILDCTRPPGPPAAFGISPLCFCYRHSCRPNENSQLLSKTSKYRAMFLTHL